MDAAGLVALAIVGLSLLAVASYRAATSVPRLRVEPSLRGSTRTGTLYVVVHNRGRATARGLVVSASWTSSDGASFLIDERRIGELAGRAAVTLTIKDLHRGLPTSVGWDDIIVRATARAPAVRGRASLALAAKRAGGATASAADAAAAPPAAVEYKRVDRCEASADGQHLFQEHAHENDGVVEHWDVCRRCHVARRRPLSPAQEATQQRIRAERLARERREMEEEFARREAQEARASAGPRAGARGGAGPTLDSDRLPVQVALWILGIDETRPTLATVEAAHRRLAKEYHPDRASAASSDPQARALLEEKMRDVNRARDVLREALRE